MILRGWVLVIDRHLGSCDDEGENGDEHFFRVVLRSQNVRFLAE